MERSAARMGKRSGWSEFENDLLWEAADEAQMNGMPLKSVFEYIAEKTGRRPNSIRNYYYAQVQKREDGQKRTARFVPFRQEEVDWLMEQVLRARAEGQSVRACLQRLSEGDHSRMLRLQNKYRSVIKSRPDYVRDVVERLNREGVPCDQPRVNHRTRPDMQAACEALSEEAGRFGDAELVHAVETLTRYLKNARQSALPEEALSAVSALVGPAKDLLSANEEERAEQLDSFLSVLSENIGRLESLLPVEGAQAV